MFRSRSSRHQRLNKINIRSHKLLEIQYRQNLCTSNHKEIVNKKNSGKIYVYSIFLRSAEDEHMDRKRYSAIFPWINCLSTHKSSLRKTLSVNALARSADLVTTQQNKYKMKENSNYCLTDHKDRRKTKILTIWCCFAGQVNYEGYGR